MAYDVEEFHRLRQTHGAYTAAEIATGNHWRREVKSMVSTRSWDLLGSILLALLDRTFKKEA